MAVKKPTWLRDAVAKPTGYYTKNGIRLKGARLSPEQIAEWNGEPVPEPAPAPKKTSQPEINKTEEVSEKPSILGRLINKFKKG